MSLKMSQINNSKPRTPHSELPRGWRWVKLGEVIQEALPGFACGKRAGSEGFIQLRMNNISNRGQIDLSSILRVPATQEQVEKYRLVPGDIMFNNTNSVELVGKTALFNEQNGIFLYSNHLTRLRPMKGNLDSVYLASWIQLQWYQRVFEIICNRWIGQAAVQREKLLNLKIPLPSLPEQKHIAAKIQEIMQEIERARMACEKQLEAAKALPSAYLREVFESEEAKKWERKRLGEVAKYINGRAFKPEEWKRIGVPIIRIENLNDPNAPFNYYNGEIEERYRVKNGDLLISWSASLGAYLWTGRNAALNQHIFRVEEDPKLILREFFYYVITYVMIEIKTKVHGATMQHITKPEFEAIVIPLPPLPEQHRIATELKEKMAQAENLKSAILNQQSALNALPQAILRKAFRGEL